MHKLIFLCSALSDSKYDSNFREELAKDAMKSISILPNKPKGKLIHHLKMEYLRFIKDKFGKLILINNTGM